VHVLSSVDVARRLMLIEKEDKWQFVVKRDVRLLSIVAARSVLVGKLINMYPLFENTRHILILFLNISISAICKVNAHLANLLTILTPQFPPLYSLHRH